MGQGSAFIFINLEQAAGFGHIGWGFQVANDKYYFGSTDHLWRLQYPFWHPAELVRYMNVAPGDNIDFWAQSGTGPELFETMSRGNHLRYHRCKELPVANCDPLQARSIADGLRHAGWNVFFNNCVHQTYQILTKYGSELPNPSQLSHRFPKSWYESIDAPEVILTPTTKRFALPPTDRQHRRAG